MKDFKRRLEFRIAMNHETKMTRPGIEACPRLCACGNPIPPRRGRGRKLLWCAACRREATLEIKRNFNARNPRGNTAT